MTYWRKNYGMFTSGPSRRPVSPMNTQKTIDENYFSEDLGFGNRVSDVTVVVPTLNEERNIGHAITQLHINGFRDVLVVDGNSYDRTVELAKDLGASVVMQNGKGKGDALRSAFGFSGIGDRVVIMDADGSMDPKEIHILLDPLRNGADVAN